jgi:hypothetical protein
MFDKEGLQTPTASDFNRSLDQKIFDPSQPIYTFEEEFRIN